MIKLWFMALGLGWQLAIEAAILSAIGGGVWYVHHHIYQGGYDACVAAQATAVHNGEKKYEKDKIEVQRLPADRLRREYCGVLIDADLPACLKALAPFRP